MLFKGKVKNKCIICGKDKIVYYDKDTTVDKAFEPCLSCKDKYMKDSMLLIEAKKVFDKKGNEIPLATGDLLFLKDQLFLEIFKEKEVPKIKLGFTPLGLNASIRKYIEENKGKITKIKEAINELEKSDK